MYRSLITITAALTLSACGEPEPLVLTPEQQELADLIEVRKANFQDMGTAFKTMRDEVGLEQPDFITLNYAARNIHGYARQLHNWFPEGSNSSLGVETEALDTIWEQREDFDRISKEFASAAEVLLAASDTKDAAQLASAMQATGAQCKACHDSYRLED